jgi:hypothetical protein
MIEPTEFNPDWRVHPGATIRELFILKIFGTDAEYDVVKQLDEILIGRGRITPDLADLLHKELSFPKGSISVKFFLGLQANFEKSKSWDSTLPDGRRERRGFLSPEEQEFHKGQGCEVLIESDGYTTVRTPKGEATCHDTLPQSQ